MSSSNDISDTQAVSTEIQLSVYRYQFFVFSAVLCLYVLFQLYYHSYISSTFFFFSVLCTINLKNTDISSKIQFWIRVFLVFPVNIINYRQYLSHEQTRYDVCSPCFILMLLTCPATIVWMKVQNTALTWTEVYQLLFEQSYRAFHF